MRFKDFEIRPITLIEGRTDPKRLEVVKWVKREKPVEVLDLRTGKMKMSDSFCYVVAILSWDEREGSWDFRSIGMRFLEDYEAGLSEFILKWIELLDITRREYDE